MRETFIVNLSVSFSLVPVWPQLTQQIIKAQHNCEASGPMKSQNMAAAGLILSTKLRHFYNAQHDCDGSATLNAKNTANHRPDTETSWLVCLLDVPTCPDNVHALQLLQQDRS